MTRLACLDGQMMSPGGIVQSWSSGCAIDRPITYDYRHGVPDGLRHFWPADPNLSGTMCGRCQKGIPMNEEPLLTADIEKIRDGAAILRLAGEVDVATAPSLVSAFRDLADQSLTEVIVDASGVSFMDSSGLHALIQGKRIIYEAGSRILLVTSRPIRMLLEVAFPEPLFAGRFDSLEEAMATLDDGSS